MPFSGDYMQKRRVIPVVVGAVLCLSAFAAAQDQPLTTHADSVVVGPNQQTTLTGNVVVVVNGVVMRADRAVIQDGEVTLEGNVRVTLPNPRSTSETMRLPAVPRLYSIETPKIDTPIPQPWQPPPRNQR
jgi:hypothetical protein